MTLLGLAGMFVMFTVLLVGLTLCRWRLREQTQAE